MANSARVVSMVCAMARKCHAGCPKKSRCSTTVVSILAAFTAYFENRTRYSRISPGRNGTAIATGAAGGLADFLECLDFCADPEEANAITNASSGAIEAKRVNPTRVLNNELVRSGEARSRRSFPACELRRREAAQRARYIQGTEKMARKPVASSLVFRCVPRQARNLETPGIRRSVVPYWYLRFEEGLKRKRDKFLRRSECVQPPLMAREVI